MHVIDATKEQVSINTPYNRIISLVPSTTESIIHLQAQETLIGVTRFCCHPKEYTKNLPKVGGTKSLDFARIKALQPDLILANKEENRKEDILYLRSQGYTVYVAFPCTVEEALHEIEILASLLHKPILNTCK